VISVGAGSYSDAAGNAGEAASSAEITYDNLPPTNNVADGGDANGDGLADLIVSPPLSDLSEDKDAWRAYVVFGKASTKIGCVPWSGVKAEACDLIGDQ
jgi:hypothetical protein